METLPASQRRGGGWAALAVVGLPLLIVIGLVIWRPSWLAGWSNVVAGWTWWWSIPIYVLVVGCLVAVGLPGTAGSVTAGAWLGLLWGLPVAYATALLASLVSFALGRASGRWQFPLPGSVTHRTGRLAEGLRGFSLGDVALLRLVPVLPYALTNIGLGRSGIGWGPYGMGTALGIVPGTVLHVYLGEIGRELWSDQRTVHPGEWAMLALGMLALGLVAWRLKRLLPRQVVDSP